MTRRVHGSANRRARREAENSRRPLDAEEASRRSAVIGLAVERAVSGTANKADWADIFDAINLLESLACRGWAGGRDVVVATQGVTVAILDRRRAGSNEVLPHEAVALRGIADDYSAVVSTIRRGRFEVAENEVTVRVRRILSKKAADGDLLMDIEELGL